MGKRKRRFTEQFKREAVLLAAERGSQTEVAQDLGISKSTLSQWKRMFDEQEPQKVSEKDLKREVARLRKRVRELELEKQIIEKAAAFFAKESE
jgi:transposase